MEVCKFKDMDDRRRILLVSLFLATILAWISPLEQRTIEYTNDTLFNAGLIYATARGINGLVTVIQSTEVGGEVGIGAKATLSTQPGQVLDPLNDLIERFSALILGALGSLALQKILLELVSTQHFNIALTVLAGLTGASLILFKDAFLTQLAKIFWVAVFIRFSLVIVLFANSWVDAAFLADSEKEKHQSMETFASDLDEARETLAIRDAAIEEMKRIDDELIPLRSEEIRISTELQGIEKQLAKENAILERLNSDNMMCYPSLAKLGCTDAVIEQQAIVDNIKDGRKKLVDSLDSLQGRIDDLDDQHSCAEKKSQGESCGLVDSITSTLSLQAQIDGVEKQMQTFTDTVVSLLALLILKTIIIPLLFLWGLAKSLGIQWSRINFQVAPQQIPESRPERIAP